MDPISAIGSNRTADQAALALVQAFTRLQGTLARISSGQRITSPEVDPAGLSQLQKLNSQIDQTNAGSSNADNAASFTDVQAGAAQQIAAAESRKGELAIRAQDPTLTDADRQAIQAEFAGLQGAQNSIMGQKFNDVPLFSGSNLSVVTDGQGSNVTLNAVNLGASVNAGGIAESTSGATSVSTVGNAVNALSTIKAGLDNLAHGFAEMGASQTQLNITRDTNSVQVQNLSAAASRIGDANIAQESANLSQFGVSVQAGILGLGRANTASRSILNALA